MGGVKSCLQQYGVLLLTVLALAGCYPAQVQYPYTAAVVNKRISLKDNLIALLPAAEQRLPAARAEAQWLADTSYKAAAGISRINGSWFPGWAGNALINARLQDRGLCWHYQHDMYRELRRRPLKFYRIGCCVRDLGKRSEHHCIYVTARGLEWPQVIILDPWIWNGRLEVMLPGKFSTAIWEDETATMPYLETVYPEAHRYPFEHWARIKSGKGWRDYINSASPAGAASRQGRLMQRRIRQGMQQRRGKLYSY